MLNFGSENVNRHTSQTDCKLVKNFEMSVFRITAWQILICSLITIEN